MARKDRLTRLEKVMNVTDEEKLIFMCIVGDDGSADALRAIHDMKRHRSVQNKDNLSDDEFLRVTSEEWDLDLTKLYGRTSNPLQWKRDTINIK